MDRIFLLNFLKANQRPFIVAIPHFTSIESDFRFSLARTIWKVTIALQFPHELEKNWSTYTDIIGPYLLTNRFSTKNKQ